MNKFTRVFACLFLNAMFAVGCSVVEKLPGMNGAKPTPRVKNQSPMAASDILQIEYTESISRVEYPAQYFSNLTPTSSFRRLMIVTFINDGRAKKHFRQTEIANRVAIPEQLERHEGAFPPEKFSELARVFIENDFTGEAVEAFESASPTNQTLTVVYSSPQRVKIFQVGDSDNDTPEAAAMLRAFKQLENQIVWNEK